jgi:hypothetical protein
MIRWIKYLFGDLKIIVRHNFSIYGSGEYIVRVKHAFEQPFKQTQMYGFDEYQNALALKKAFIRDRYGMTLIERLMDMLRERAYETPSVLIERCLRKQAMANNSIKNDKEFIENAIVGQAVQRANEKMYQDILSELKRDTLSKVNFKVK